MAYLGDIRENSIGPNGEIWESDNRVEERYYYNGMFIDLCGLSPEDYAKTIFVTNGSSNNDTPNLKIKQVTLNIVNGDVVVTFAGAATSDMYVGITYNGGKEHTLKIEKDTMGGSGLSFGIEETVESINEFGIGLTETDALNYKKTFEDDEFKYQINYNAPIVYPVAYQLVLMKGDIDNLSNEELISRIQKLEKLPMKGEKESEVFIADVKPIPVEGLGNMTVEELSEVLLANAQELIIITDKEIKDIVAASTNDSVIDGWFKKESDLIINKIPYHIWVKRPTSTELSAIYDPTDTEMKIEIEKDSITYIIYYK